MSSTVKVVEYSLSDICAFFKGKKQEGQCFCVNHDLAQSSFKDLTFGASLVLGVAHDVWNSNEHLYRDFFWSISVKNEQIQLKPWVEIKGKKVEALDLLKNKFSKLSYLFLEDFFIQQNGGLLKDLNNFINEKGIGGELILIGPFSGVEPKSSANETLKRIRGGQVSALLALCKRMTQTTPQWLIDGLSKMDEQVFNEMSIESMSEKRHGMNGH